MLAAQKKALEEQEKESEETEVALPPTPQLLPRTPNSGESSGQKQESPEEHHNPKMPGAFVDSPERAPMIPNILDRAGRQTNKPKSLLSSITRGLGLDKHIDGRSQKPFGEESLPHLGSSLGPDSGPNAGVTSPEALEGNLRNAINASKSWDSKALFTQPQTQQVKEQYSYCDSTLVPAIYENYLLANFA